MYDMLNADFVIHLSLFAIPKLYAKTPLTSGSLTPLPTS